MRDVRLAVCHPDEAVRAGIAARLHGASVVPIADCEAAMCAGLGAPEEMLRAGIHVLLVAEPCQSATGLEVLSHVARGSGAKLAHVNPDRYLPSRQLVRKQLAGPLGDTGLIRTHRWDARPAAEVAGLPEPLLRDIDVALWLAGRVPDRVCAVGNTSDAGRVVQVHLGFPHGGSALLDYTDTLPQGEGYTSLSVIAASGAVYADDQQNTQLLYGGGRPLALRVSEGTTALAALAQEFVNAIRDDRECARSNWKAVFAVAGAATQSLASGRAIALEAPT